MAESPAHKFGQIIGELLEQIVRPQLEDFCKKHNLYLDYQKKNRPARNGRKVTWTDQYGNAHDLDFVIERDGSDLVKGRPVGFIEVAWRRYTKHSRNKTQEIQGAILPLAEKYRWNNPFLGVILAGIFTEGSLEQLKSTGFNILYFPYNTLISAFLLEGVNIRFDEDTPDNIFQETAEIIKNIPPEISERIINHIISSNQNNIDYFLNSLNNRLKRQITRIVIIPLYGHQNEFLTISDALQFLNAHSIYEGSGDFRKYEISIEFSNNDKVQAFLEDKEKIIEFLEFVSNQ